MSVKKFTQMAYDNLGDKQEVAIDPEMILKGADIITTTVVNVIKLLQTCKKTPEQAVLAVSQPSEEQQSQLKTIIRKELGWWKNFWQGTKIYNALVKTGQQSTVADMRRAFKEIINETNSQSGS